MAPTTMMMVMLCLHSGILSTMVFPFCVQHDGDIGYDGAAVDIDGHDDNGCFCGCYHSSFDRIHCAALSFQLLRFAVEHAANAYLEEAADAYLEVAAVPDELESDHHTADISARGRHSEKQTK